MVHSRTKHIQREKEPRTTTILMVTTAAIAKEAVQQKSENTNNKFHFDGEFE